MSARDAVEARMRSKLPTLPEPVSEPEPELVEDEPDEDESDDADD